MWHIWEKWGQTHTNSLRRVLRAVTGHKLDYDLVKLFLERYTAQLRDLVMALILNHIVVMIRVFTLFQVSTSTMVTTSCNLERDHFVR